MSTNPFSHLSKLLFHRQHITNIIRNERPFPIHLEIDLANICNHKCSFCNMADTLANDKSVIKTDILIKALNDSYQLGAKAISFTGGGEPTMHKDFAKITRACREIGFDLGLITNGSLIRKDIRQAIVEDFQWIRISLGGPTEKSYEQIQGKNDFKKVLHNILGLKSSSKDKSLNVGLKIMLTPENIKHFPDCTSELIDNGINSESVDYVQLVPDQFTNDGGEFVRSNLVKIACSQLQEGLDKLGIPLLGSYFSVDNDYRDLDKSKTCFAHFFQLVITAEGFVTFCKNSRETTDLHIGNIYKDSIADIWNSSTVKDLEDYICASNCNTFCKSLNINNAIEDLANPPLGYSKNFF